jgi:hypothetical protein
MSAAEAELADLPPPNVRWIPRRKAQVLSAISRGLIDVDAVCARYALSQEELASWQLAANSRDGLNALKITRLVQHRRNALGVR